MPQNGADEMKKNHEDTSTERLTRTWNFTRSCHVQLREVSIARSQKYPMVAPLQRRVLTYIGDEHSVSEIAAAPLQIGADEAFAALKTQIGRAHV